MTEKEKLFGFASSALMLTALFAAAGVPVPLYNLYIHNLNLATSVLSLTAVLYFAGTVSALLFFARLSNYWGRKPVIYLTLVLGIAGCLLLSNVTNLYLLLGGRLLQGLSCGLASSTVTAFIIDNEPQKYSGWAAVMIGSLPNIGIVAGALGAGIINEFSTSLALAFIAVIILLLLCVILAYRCRETVPQRAGVWQSLVPQIKLTAYIKHMLPAAACAFAGSWAVGGFYQAFSSAIALRQFGLESTFVASLVLVSFILPIALGALLARGHNNFLSQRYGMTIFFMSFLGILFSLQLPSILPFLLLNVLAGTAEGAVFTASMNIIMEETSLADRAGVLSLIYIISYAGAVLPNLLVSRIADSLTLYQITAGYVILVGISWLVILLTARQKV